MAQRLNHPIIIPPSSRRTLGRSRDLRAREYRNNRWQRISKLELMRAHGQRCQRCRRILRSTCTRHYDPRNPHIGHIIPIAHGGRHVWSNVMLLCQECNLRQNTQVDGELEMLAGSASLVNRKGNDNGRFY